MWLLGLKVCVPTLPAWLSSVASFALWSLGKLYLLDYKQNITLSREYTKIQEHTLKLIFHIKVFKWSEKNRRGTDILNLYRLHYIITHSYIDIPWIPRRDTSGENIKLLFKILVILSIYLTVLLRILLFYLNRNFSWGKRQCWELEFQLLLS